MSIIDELRNCIRTANRSYEEMRNPCNDREILHIPEEELLKIADRIDERHERDLRESYDSGYASADDWLAQHEDAMAEHGWIRLPLDADGVPIRIGDELDGYNQTIRVERMEIAEDGEWRLIDDACVGWYATTAFSHHCVTTVEDVLREFAEGLGVPVVDSYIAACAAKLRLAGDE